MKENLAAVAEIEKKGTSLGGPDTYEHYPTGWAVATSTPFKMYVQTGKFTLCGDGLCVGYDSADAVAKYGDELEEPSNPFKDGIIHKVIISTKPLAHTLPAKVLAGAFAAD